MTEITRRTEPAKTIMEIKKQARDLLASIRLLGGYETMMTLDGDWADITGEIIFTSGFNSEIDWDTLEGPGYLAARVDGEWITVKPYHGGRSDRPARIRFTFKIA